MYPRFLYSGAFNLIMRVLKQRLIHRLIIILIILLLIIIIIKIIIIIIIIIIRVIGSTLYRYLIVVSSLTMRLSGYRLHCVSVLLCASHMIVRVVT